MTMQGFTTIPQKIKRVVSSLSLPDFLWPQVLLFLAIAAVINLNNDNPDALLTFTFHLLVPGMALIRLMEFDSPYIEWAMAIGLSIALTSLISFVSIFFSIMSFETGSYILIAVSFVGSGFQIKRWFKPPSQSSVQE